MTEEQKENIMKNIHKGKKFEVGKAYKGKLAEYETMTVSKRTKKTLWYCDDMFHVRIKINKYGNEYVLKPCGIITRLFEE